MEVNTIIGCATVRNQDYMVISHETFSRSRVDTCVSRDSSENNRPNIVASENKVQFSPLECAVPMLNQNVVGIFRTKAL